MLLLLSTLLVGACQASSTRKTLRGLQNDEPVHYVTAFRNQRHLVAWPTPHSTADDISSTFGPRIRLSCDCYDFHRGIDISGDEGDVVLASFDGKVKKVANYRGGGLTVILEHGFPETASFKGISVTRWYTHYMHLSAENVTRGQTVKGGQEIGRVGKTGAAVSPHLHHEIRVGTRCSLEWALNNPSSTCNRLGIDPHIHPLLVYPEMTGFENSATLTLTQTIDATQDGILHVTAPDETPDVNVYQVQVINNTTGVVRLTHTLDLNLRLGFDASSTSALDTPDTSVPYLDPGPHGVLATEWDMDLVIPSSWFIFKNADEDIVVTVTNVWEDAPKVLVFGEGKTW